MMEKQTVCFLNKTGNITDPEDWNDPTQDKLWLYNLHYFDDLNAENASSRTEWHQTLLQRWIEDNPPASGCGWEPYPTSLRIINWIKWSLSGNGLREAWQHSLAIQVRYLNKRLEYHILGNHLFCNAKALVFAGLYFEGKEADHWLNKGFSILAEQIPEQILTDGGQFELSPMYHALALEDMLDLWNICSTYESDIPPKWRRFVEEWPNIINRMHKWLSAMNHPDGEIGFFNDAVIGVAPNLETLEHYAAILGLPTTESAPKTVTHLETSGYIRVEKDEMVALLDVAPIGPDYLPGHAHADTLSFELSLFDQRLLVNSGTSCYGADQERNRQRGTAAHNTVVINKENSSEVWAGFRVGRRAYPKLLNIEERRQKTVITASHNGYSWLPGNNCHQRSWQFETEAIIVEDRITGSFEEAKNYLHLHPSVIYSVNSDRHVTLLLPNKQKIQLTVEGGLLQIENSSWHPQFGMSVASACLIVIFNETSIKTKICWGRCT